MSNTLLASRRIALRGGSSLIVDATFTGTLACGFKDGSTRSINVDKCGWSLVGGRGGRYAAARIGATIFYAHRLAVGAQGGVQVDHVNGDTLDCRCENLRIATHGQNLVAQLKDRKRASAYRGVRPCGRGWIAVCKKDGKKISSRVFYSEIDAAKERDRMCRELWGEFAVLNFPGDAQAT